MLDERRWEEPVLVPEAHAVGAIGVVRSLGRAGYRVHAMATRDDALGLRSRFSAAAVVSPPYSSPAFLPWLREYVAANGIKAIVPSEAFLLAVRPAIEEFLPLMAVPRSAELIFAGMSKYDLFRDLLGAGGAASAHLPPTRLYEEGVCVGDNASHAELRWPVFLKGDACYSLEAADGAILAARSETEFEEGKERFSRRFSRYLVQGYAPGRDAGVYFLLWKGEVLARFMNLALHSVPHTGGFYSLRTSCFDEDLFSDALAKVRRVGWEGVVMMEYRWTPTDRQFAFVEMNARFWGSLHHALYAGVDFPRLLLDAFFGRRVEPALAYPEGLRCRYTFPAEVGYVSSRLRDPQVSLAGRLWSAIEFFLLFADFRCRSDLCFPGDEALYWESLRRAVRRP